jgi:hypothetical protein
MSVNEREHALKQLHVYALIVAMRGGETGLGFYLEGAPCPNCAGEFVYALELDSSLRPLEYCRCVLCGWEAVQVTQVEVIADEFATQPIVTIQEKVAAAPEQDAAANA